MAKRRHYGREAWDRACELVRADDGLKIFETKGMWTAHKLFFLCCYLEQVCRGMTGNPAFPDGLTYVDLFAATGVTVVSEDDGISHRYPGSAVIAASLSNKPFDRLVLVEQDSDSVAAVTARVAAAGFKGLIQTVVGDANKVVEQVVALVPARSLNVAFIDPCSLQIHFETIKRLTRQRALDLVILLSDRIDLQRNVHETYYQQQGSKLDHFLGVGSDWRARYDTLADRSGGKLREMFAEIYRDQLQTLGYVHSKSWPLKGPMGPMFRLVFASKNALGLKYCEIAQNEDLGGQRDLFI